MLQLSNNSVPVKWVNIIYYQNKHSNLDIHQVQGDYFIHKVSTELYKAYYSAKVSYYQLTL